MSDALVRRATGIAERPARGWFNRFLVLENPDRSVVMENNGWEVPAGEHDDCNVFPSKDSAETFAVEQMKRHPADVRALVIWLGAFPVEETDKP